MLLKASQIFSLNTFNTSRNLARSFVKGGRPQKNAKGEFLHNKEEVVLDMHIREPTQKFHKLHPRKQQWIEKTTQPTEPLLYKLKDIENVPTDFCPALPIEERVETPFHIERTKSGNLPVYRDYKNQRYRVYTEIRMITGDVNAFVEELGKIVSNCHVNPKVGRVVVTG